jgi:hypothetical protein
MKMKNKRYKISLSVHPSLEKDLHVKPEPTQISILLASPSFPYLQILDLAKTACQGQTLWLIQCLNCDNEIVSQSSDKMSELSSIRRTARLSDEQLHFDAL